MRVRFANYIDELSGRDVGIVFSKNRAGTYVKNFVSPTNPQTTSQVLARQVFSNVVPVWGNLTPAQRSAWDVFANSDYKPLDPSTWNKGFTGRQANQALNTVTSYFNTATAGYTAFTNLFAVGSTSSSSLTPGTFSTGNTPPAAYFVSGELTFNSVNYLITDLSFERLGAKSVYAVLTLNSSIPAAAVTNQPLQVGGTTCAIHIYASESVSKSGFKVGSPFAHKILLTKPYNSVSITPATASPTLKLGSSNTAVDYTFPAGWHLCSVVAVSSAGGQRVLFQKYVDLTGI